MFTKEFFEKKKKEIRQSMYIVDRSLKMYGSTPFVMDRCQELMRQWNMIFKDDFTYFDDDKDSVD